MKLIKDGNKKVFEDTCELCFSDFQYILSDVEISPTPRTSRVRCPKCERIIEVGMLEKDLRTK